MCFALKRRAISRPENFKKCSEPNMLCTCSLANALRATVACNFWFLCGPLASAPAALTGLLFDWHDTRIIEKTQHFATSLTFGADVSSFFWLSHYCIFFLLTWLLYYCAFHLLFNSPYCRKFLFKFPSTNSYPTFPPLGGETFFDFPLQPHFCPAIQAWRPWYMANVQGKILVIAVGNEDLVFCNSGGPVERLDMLHDVDPYSGLWQFL